MVLVSASIKGRIIKMDAYNEEQNTNKDITKLTTVEKASM
jgi:hypothetical protein